MSEAQRVGQLIHLGLGDDRLGPEEIDAIRTRHIGSVWFIATTTEGATAVRAVADAVQRMASKKNTEHVGFFVAANQEGGLIQGLRGPGFSTIPSAVDQGRLSTSTLQTDAKTWGSELVAAGVNMNFAPVMDVVPAGSESQNQPIGVLHRNFGTTTGVVSSHGVAFLEGMAQAGVTATAKHFPGLGRVEGNTDFSSGVVDGVTTPDDPYLQPFGAAVKAGVPFVMVALATYTKIDPNRLAVFSPTVMSLLRDQIGFDGVIISDDLGEAVAIKDIPPGQRAIDFLDAGGDMIISKTTPPALDMVDAVLAKANEDDGFRSKVDGAALRILEAKDAAGLLPCSST